MEYYRIVIYMNREWMSSTAACAPTPNLALFYFPLTRHTPSKETHMSEIRRLHDQLRRSYEGEAWHGPALRELLAGVTPAQAAKRSIANAHTIGELVLHIAAWADATRKALDGAPMPTLPWEGDWPSTGAPTEQAWADALASLERAQRGLLDALQKLPESRLSEKVAGRDYSFYFVLHGVVQHNLYHAGQIALLKKT